MKLRVILVAARLSLVSLCLASPAHADPTSISPQWPGEVTRVLEAQVQAWNKKDLEGYMAGYWKSPELTFFGGKEIARGWQETLERYRKKYRPEDMGRLSFEQLSIVPLGDSAALARGRWRLEPSRAAGKSSQGVFTVILKKLPEGWKIIHDHSC
jgi:ketosteroid isomerase-like protein